MKNVIRIEDCGGNLEIFLDGKSIHKDELPQTPHEFINLLARMGLLINVPGFGVAGVEYFTEVIEVGQDDTYEAKPDPYIPY